MANFCRIFMLSLAIIQILIMIYNINDLQTNYPYHYVTPFSCKILSTSYDRKIIPTKTSIYFGLSECTNYEDIEQWKFKVDFDRYINNTELNNYFESLDGNLDLYHYNPPDLFTVQPDLIEKGKERMLNIVVNFAGALMCFSNI